MLGRSNGDNDSQTSGVLIQYIRDISAYLREKDLSKKAVTMAAAVLVLTGLLGIHYREQGTLLPTVAGGGNRQLPIYCVQTEEPKIALTFDAAWGNDDTQKIMEILKKHDVKVTFFMTGGWVESYPDDVKMILAEGHDLGNHSQNHKNMSQIQWDVDSLDWKDYGVDSIIKTVTQNAHLGNGTIILCHNGAKYTADALDTMITTLKEAGYQFVPLSELIYRDKYHMDHEGRQIPDK